MHGDDLTKAIELTTLACAHSVVDVVRHEHFKLRHNTVQQSKTGAKSDRM